MPMKCLPFGYLPTDCLCIYGENIYRREHHFTDAGDVFVAVDIVTGQVMRGIDNQTSVKALSKDYLDRVHTKHVLKKRKIRCTKRQFVYVDTRIQHPEMSMSECARQAGYGKRVSRNADKIERRCKKLFSAYIFIKDKMYAQYGLDETPTGDDDMRVS